MDADAVYKTLGHYNNSVACRKRCRYARAMELMNNRKYSDALSLLESIGNYSDSYLQARACRYGMAVVEQEAGNYKEAAELFAKAGQYQDSMARMKTCFEKQNISIYYIGADAVSTGVDNGYKETNAIEKGDKHFGWRLGRFFVSGYTRVNTDDVDQPIFIKTLGDSVTVWFDLEQLNIDRLNNNEYLSVCEDTNGCSQDFNVPQTNFGRGTLIVRHTDYQNKAGEPQIYTDFLLAKGTSGANTYVVLHEEGDYEVGLFYELQDSDVTHITTKYGNYKILFHFSVRNGNCMVYPFDVATRAELQNTAITENGFYLDLARSRYLDIDVKRSVIVDSPAGVIEDVRFNRPAKDGDQYTQEGIYTISVSNRYTGEATTKTIFVGSDELLQEYISNGFSMDRLN